jgi:hypothetical protein
MDEQSETPDLLNDAKIVERRKALTRMGLFAAFTAPLLLGMLKSEKAAAASV